MLDTVNDLPGALVQIRRALRPGGLFLGAFAGAGSLPKLRAAFRTADPGAARIHPQIDVRAAGDLLHRTGFALPVADVEGLTARYADLPALIRDLRGMAATNVLADRSPLSRATYAAAATAFAAQADPDGRVAERFEIVFMTGWSPAAPRNERDQRDRRRAASAARPSRPASATVRHRAVGCQPRARSPPCGSYRAAADALARTLANVSG